MVKDDKVIIIDEFTGRMMEGRRYSDGLHQALEAKENVTIQMENQTLASITFQNLFRLYPKLSGMTGTAKTEATELGDIYKLEVIQVPTNLPLAQQDLDDEVYRTAGEKYEAIIKLIQECREKNQPILVGTVSIEKSEYLSELLKKKNIPHQVLNARYHEQEAMIISQAGSPGAVTIATNMAGRGTDIKLGGNVDIRLAFELKDITDPSEHQRIEEKIREEMATAEREVKAAGGLFVIGTERHESRRIDNQLRGRSGRQGDPGKSKFFLSLDDDLMRIFGSNRIDGMLQKLGLQPGEAITHPWINKALERAQQKVEAHNYDIRKHLIKYDDVMNDQRKVIYEQRRELMIIEDASELVREMEREVLDTSLLRFIPEDAYSDQWEVKGLHEECMRIFGLDLPIEEWSKEEGIAEAEIRQRIESAIQDKMKTKEDKYGSDSMRMAEKSILLRVLDQIWKDHLHALDYVRQGINLRAYAQRDPLNEYKQEAFSLYQEMLGKIKEQVVTALCYIELYQESPSEIFNAAIEDIEGAQRNIRLEQPGLDSVKQDLPATKTRNRLVKSIRKVPLRPHAKKTDLERVDVSLGTIDESVPRNAPCPCGSGRRYKHCHGK
jgi:preprotein translocase subunit SecA